jgi:hypothetical protein
MSLLDWLKSDAGLLGILGRMVRLQNAKSDTSLSLSSLSSLAICLTSLRGINFVVSLGTPHELLAIVGFFT